MKYALRIVGLLAILFALYIIVGEQLVGASSNAYVNTRLATLRMPLEGSVQLSAGPVGARIAAGESLGMATRPQGSDGEITWILDGRLQAAADLRAYEADPDISPVALNQAIERLKAYEEAREAMRGQQVATNSAALRSPVKGIVWSVSAHSGEYLPRGEPIARIADCEELFVHATVDQRLYDKLRPGDVAQFRFQEGGVVEMTVSLLAGTGPRTIYETLAVSPTARQSEGFAVFLEGALVDPDDLCPIGKTGRVVFSKGPVGWFGDFLGRIGI